MIRHVLRARSILVLALAPIIITFSSVASTASNVTSSYLGDPRLNGFWAAAAHGEWSDAADALSKVGAADNDLCSCRLKFLDGMAVLGKDENKQKNASSKWNEAVSLAERQHHAPCLMLAKAGLFFVTKDKKQLGDRASELEAIGRSESDAPLFMAHVMNLIGTALIADSLSEYAKSFFDAALCVSGQHDPENLTAAAVWANLASIHSEKIISSRVDDPRLLHKASRIASRTATMSPAAVKLLDMLASKQRVEGFDSSAFRTERKADSLRAAIEASQEPCVDKRTLLPWSGMSTNFVTAQCSDLGLDDRSLLVCLPELKIRRWLEHFGDRQQRSRSVFGMDVPDWLQPDILKRVFELREKIRDVKFFVDLYKESRHKFGIDVFLMGLTQAQSYPITLKSTALDSLVDDPDFKRRMAEADSSMQAQLDSMWRIGTMDSLQAQIMAIKDSMMIQFGYAVGLTAMLGMPVLDDKDRMLTKLVDSGKDAEALVRLETMRSYYYLWTRAFRKLLSDPANSESRKVAVNYYKAVNNRIREMIGMFAGREALCDATGLSKDTLLTLVSACKANEEMIFSSHLRSEKSQVANFEKLSKSIKSPIVGFSSPEQLKRIVPAGGVLISMACVASEFEDRGKTVVIIAAHNKTGNREGTIKLMSASIDYDALEWYLDANDFRNAASSPDTPLEKLRRLGSSAFQRFFPTEEMREAAKSATHAILCIDGELAEMPFQLFIPDSLKGSYWGIGTAISFVQSVEMLIDAESDKKESHGSSDMCFAGVSDWNTVGFSGSLDSHVGGIVHPFVPQVDLPGAKVEAERLASIFGVSPVLNSEANERHIRSLLPSAGVVHLATHGFYPSGLEASVPLISGVWLRQDSSGSDSDSADGLLQAWEVNFMPELKAELVTLSACESGRVRHGSALGDLPMVFIIAGASSVIASQWKVSDESTVMFMEKFYDLYRSGMAKDNAIKNAMMFVASKSDFSHPYYWAAFRLIGKSD